MRGIVAVAVFAGLAGCLVCCKREPDVKTAKVTPTQAKANSLLGKWVESVGTAEGSSSLTFKEDGTVTLTSPTEGAETMQFKRESFEDWKIRREKEIAKTDPKGGEDFAKGWESFGPITDAVTMTNAGQEGEMTLFLYAKQQLLMLPISGPIYVRPGQEKRASTRIDAGDGSQAPFHFLESYKPIFADGTTGDWAYTFQGDWRKVLPEAAREVRTAGFDGPPVEKEEAGLKGETGSVIYYRSLDSEKVVLAPNLRSEWKDGKWVTHGEKGWITVHVNIKTAP